MCNILNDGEFHSKWNSKSDEGIFLVYSSNRRCFRVFNKCTKTVLESINLVASRDSYVKENDDY